MQLIASREPLKSICQSGVDFITPPTGAKLDLSNIQKMICNLNVTILMQQLKDQIKLDELLLLVSEHKPNVCLSHLQLLAFKAFLTC
jgi:hypothetical protein